MALLRYVAGLLNIEAGPIQAWQYLLMFVVTTIISLGPIFIIAVVSLIFTVLGFRSLLAPSGTGFIMILFSLPCLILTGHFLIVNFANTLKTGNSSNDPKSSPKPSPSHTP